MRSLFKHHRSGASTAIRPRTSAAPAHNLGRARCLSGHHRVPVGWFCDVTAAAQTTWTSAVLSAPGCFGFCCCCGGGAGAGAGGVGAGAVGLAGGAGLCVAGGDLASSSMLGHEVGESVRCSRSLSAFSAICLPTTQWNRSQQVVTAIAGGGGATSSIHRCSIMFNPFYPSEEVIMCIVRTRKTKAKTNEYCQR